MVGQDLNHPIPNNPRLSWDFLKGFFHPENTGEGWLFGSSGNETVGGASPSPSVLGGWAPSGCKRLISTVMVSPLKNGIIHLPNGRKSWLVNRGHPNHFLNGMILQVQHYPPLHLPRPSHGSGTGSLATSRVERVGIFFCPLVQMSFIITFCGQFIVGF